MLVYQRVNTSWWFFTNPIEKYARQNGFIFPKFRGEHKKIFELPPPSMYANICIYICFLQA